MRFVFMVVSSRILFRFKANIYLAFHSVWALYKMAKPKVACTDSGIAPLAKKPHFNTQFGTCQEARKLSSNRLDRF